MTRTPSNKAKTLFAENALRDLRWFLGCFGFSEEALRAFAPRSCRSGLVALFSARMSCAEERLGRDDVSEKRAEGRLSMRDLAAGSFARERAEEARSDSLREAVPRGEDVLPFVLRPGEGATSRPDRGDFRCDPTPGFAERAPEAEPWCFPTRLVGRLLLSDAATLP